MNSTGITEFLNLITWSALQLVREIMREASRSGKTIEQLITDAEAQTKVNAALVANLKAKLEAMQGDD